jgi:hypothetical protein
MTYEVRYGLFQENWRCCGDVRAPSVDELAFIHCATTPKSDQFHGIACDDMTCTSSCLKRGLVSRDLAIEYRNTLLTLLERESRSKKQHAQSKWLVGWGLDRRCVVHRTILVAALDSFVLPVVEKRSKEICICVILLSLSRFMRPKLSYNLHSYISVGCTMFTSVPSVAFC